MADEDIFDRLHHHDEQTDAVNAQIQALADEYDWTYQEALNYVITVGLAYARRPPQTAGEPGA